jgi:hypothetical protein
MPLFFKMEKIFKHIVRFNRKNKLKKSLSHQYFKIMLIRSWAVLQLPTIIGRFGKAKQISRAKKLN